MPPSLREIRLKFHKSNAERIPEAEWNKYKGEVIFLYKEKGKTLKEIVQYMIEQHQFTASERQYRSRFKDWNVWKYTRGTSTTNGTEAPRRDDVGSPVTTPSSGLEDLLSPRQPLSPLKHARSEHSRSFSDSGYASSTPSAPARKRFKQGELTTFEEVLSDTSVYDSKKCSGKARRNPSVENACLDHLVDRNLNIWTRKQQQLAAMSPAWYCDEVASLDFSRTVDTFDMYELRDMERAADFLSSMGLAEKAFGVYVLLLKRVVTCEPGASYDRVSRLKIACARTARSAMQWEIVDSLLGQKSDEPEDLYILLEAFRNGRLLLQDPAYSTESHRIEALLDSLPPKDRSLDLLLFHLIKVQATQSESIEAAKDSLIRLRPGPFELDGRYLRNPCLRSCLSWCVIEIGRYSTNVDPFDTTTDSDQQLKFAVDNLFSFFWQRWQSGHSKVEPGLLRWTYDSEVSMGISACELLYTLTLLIAWTVFGAHPNNSLRFSQQLDDVRVSIMLKSAIRLSQCSDEELAHQFLGVLFNKPRDPCAPSAHVTIEAEDTLHHDSYEAIGPFCLAPNNGRTNSYQSSTSSLKNSGISSLQRLAQSVRSLRLDPAEPPSNVYHEASTYGLRVPSISGHSDGMIRSLMLPSLNESEVSVVERSSVVELADSYIRESVM